MLKLYKMSEEEKMEMNISPSDNYYSFRQGDELLGFAKINVLKEIYWKKKEEMDLVMSFIHKF